MVTMSVIALLFSCTVTMSSAQSSQFPNMESTDFFNMESTLFPDMSSTEFPMIFSSFGGGSVCEYFGYMPNYISCDNANNYGYVTGSISSYEIACIDFSNPVQQDVTFSTCQSSFDTNIIVGDSQGIISSSVCLNGNGMITHILYTHKI